MPTVAQLPGRIRVVFYHDDHDPPHFHVERLDRSVLFRIADLSVNRGRAIEWPEPGRPDGWPVVDADGLWHMAQAPHIVVAAE